MTIETIIEKINTHAELNQGLQLSAEEVKVLSKSVGKLRFVPVFKMDDVEGVNKYLEKQRRSR
ncbi:hypothetical protein B0181_11860 [Moraxella caviae]|uniref:Uncharacterized protein n=1 Tax=Moraxella caviae TaxID=34060 RepID=A0A1S9ZS52_9GAMM|nr:hypothetical protein [Moraxella caviae]OOR85881.1 hypothetical protein B0181_11860 [Moraxella caviae]STZ14018.1 Uncharacterised protein [Moraxella caviae]VEW12846.1 Uncharacterised protein [Moraxella caviae]